MKYHHVVSRGDRRGWRKIGFGDGDGERVEAMRRQLES